MRILFDHSTPVPLRAHLSEHLVVTAHEAGWATLSNGDLLAAAEANLLITTDKNLRHQQTVVGRQIAILVLPTTSWPRIRARSQIVVEAIRGMKPGQLHELGAFDDWHVHAQ